MVSLEGNLTAQQNLVDRTDALSVAIRDMEFRLARHGIVGDPRTYFDKETGYDRSDPLFDDDELVSER